MKRNMNNITHKNAFINTNDLFINHFYNHVPFLSIYVLPVALIPEIVIKT